jgi:GT2 family glycosyltransferase
MNASDVRFSLIMPFLNEAGNLPATLASLAAQSVSRARITFVGVDNTSSDGSGDLVRAWLAACGIAGRVVVEPVRSIPRALNAGLRFVRPGDVVVRIDAHTLYAVDYLETIAAAFATLPADVWCVGGAPTPPEPDSFTSGLLAALYTNPLGLGPADFRATLQAPRAVDHVYLGAWRPGVLESLGGFDERWLANEDSELSARVIEAGGRVYRVAARCSRKETRGIAGTVRQWSRYGFWRAQTLKRHPQMTRPRHLATPIALLGFVALVLSPLRALALGAYALYAAATIAKRPPGEPSAVTAGTLAFFPAVHVGFALGLLRGAVRTPATFKGGDGSEGAKSVGDNSLSRLGDSVERPLQ